MIVSYMYVQKKLKYQWDSSTEQIFKYKQNQLQAERCQTAAIFSPNYQSTEYASTISILKWRVKLQQGTILYLH